MEKRAFELKNIDIVKIWKAMEKLGVSTGGSVEFKFSMAVNKTILKPIIDVIASLEKPSDKIIEYSNKYHSILKEFENSELSKEEIQEQVTEKRMSLDSEYKDELVTRMNQMQEFDKFLNSTQSLELYSFNTEDILLAFKSVDARIVTPEDFGNLMLLKD